MTPSHELTCQELAELVTEYLEGAMPPPESTRFEAHLAGCPGCAIYLEQMRETVRLVGMLTEESIPVEGRERLLRAFRTWQSA